MCIYTCVCVFIYVSIYLSIYRHLYILIWDQINMSATFCNIILNNCPEYCSISSSQTISNLAHWPPRVRVLHLNLETINAIGLKHRYTAALLSLYESAWVPERPGAMVTNVANFHETVQDPQHQQTSFHHVVDLGFLAFFTTMVKTWTSQAAVGNRDAGSFINTSGRSRGRQWDDKLGMNSSRNSICFRRLQKVKARCWGPRVPQVQDTCPIRWRFKELEVVKLGFRNIWVLGICCLEQRRDGVLPILPRPNKWWCSHWC